jgi:iron(III) transport system ATP-binding protein
MSDPVLELEDVTRTFGSETAVEDLSLTVREGELLTLLGPSGCGKTTTLRLLAGLERPDEGAIHVRGDLVAAQDTLVQPEERDIGLIFQDFALFPHLSVGNNIAFGIQERPDDEIDGRVEELLDLVNLSGYRDHSPDSLSGGQRQRVALARSLAPEPDVLLLDEPFSNLDVGLRKEMREEVRRILMEAGVTAISVTHDQEEALSISDRVAVMNDGRLEQVGRPEGVFQHPTSRFVADFLGEAGFVTGRLADSQLETPLGALATDRLRDGGPDHYGTNVDVLVRPDDLHATLADGSAANGQIVYRQYTGPSFVYRIELDSGDVVHCEQNHVERFDLGEKVRVELTADHSLAWFSRD